MKKVSVVIPTYKRSEFLPRAVESVLRQTYQAVEILIVDDNGDGSPFRAETKARIAPYLNDTVRYIENPQNIGGARARNVGIEAATGDYITFLDDDDIYLPEKIRVQVGWMDDMDWELSFMDAEMRTPEGALIDLRTHDLPPESDCETLLTAHLTAHLTPTATYMFKAGKLREIGGFDEVKTGHEFLLMLKAIEADFRIGYIQCAELIQYVHPGERISSGRNKVEGENAIYAVKRRYYDRLTPAQRREIDVRHYATLFFVRLKRRELLPALYCGARAALASPAAALRLIARNRRMMAVKVNLDPPDGGSGNR